MRRHPLAQRREERIKDDLSNIAEPYRRIFYSYIQSDYWRKAELGEAEYVEEEAPSDSMEWNSYMKKNPFLMRENRLMQEEGWLKDILSQWSDNEAKIIINAIVNSDIFGATESEETEYMCRHAIPAPKGYDIYVTGNRLTQVHRSVFIVILRIFEIDKGIRKEAIQKTSLYELLCDNICILAQLGKREGKRNLKWLDKYLYDIRNLFLEIKIQTTEYYTRLLLVCSIPTFFSEGYYYGFSVPLKMLFDNDTTTIDTTLTKE